MQNQNDVCKDAQNTRNGSNHSNDLTAGDLPKTCGGEPGPEQQRALLREKRPGTELEFAAVDPWPDPVDAAALLDELERTMKRFVVLPKHAAETLALWTLHTYAFGLRDVSTYLGVESPEKRCGKTTLLSLLSELVERPVAAANISSSAMFRVIEETRPTLLIDEADTFLRGNEELRGILNSGYTRKTAYVVRVANEKKCKDQGLMSKGSKDASPSSEASNLASSRANGTRLVRFSCWCPKVMAAIGRLPDTLADRCIVIRMQRKLAGEECERLRLLDPTALKRKCLRLVRDHAEAIAEASATIPAELNDRAGDIWEPLLVLAELAGGAWPEKARQAAVALAANAQERSPIGALLRDMLLCFVGWRTDKMFSRDLVSSLGRATDRPWAELCNGRELTERWLAKQLRPYGIFPRTVWVGDEQAKGYVREDFQEILARYVSQSEWEAFRGSGNEPGCQSSEIAC